MELENNNVLLESINNLHFTNLEIEEYFLKYLKRKRGTYFSTKNVSLDIVFDKLGFEIHFSNYLYPIIDKKRKTVSRKLAKIQKKLLEAKKIKLKQFSKKSYKVISVSD